MVSCQQGHKFQVTGCQEFPRGNVITWEEDFWFLNSSKVLFSSATALNSYYCFNDKKGGWRIGRRWSIFRERLVKRWRTLRRMSVAVETSASTWQEQITFLFQYASFNLIVTWYVRKWERCHTNWNLTLRLCTCAPSCPGSHCNIQPEKSLILS